MGENLFFKHLRNKSSKILSCNIFDKIAEEDDKHEFTILGDFITTNVERDRQKILSMLSIFEKEDMTEKEFKEGLLSLGSLCWELYDHLFYQRIRLLQSENRMIGKPKKEEAK